MIPAIDAQIAHEDAYLFNDTRFISPIFPVGALLWQLEHSERRGEKIVVAHGPQSLVWNGFLEGYYFFRSKSRVSFASFATGEGNFILSTELRYNDPLDPNSGKRPFALLTAWEGVAQLLKSAVKRSKVWKDLQTVEVSSYIDEHGTEFVTYEVSAKARVTRTLPWKAGDQRTHAAGANRFVKNQTEILAQVEVRLGVDGATGQEVEDICFVRLYPELTEVSAESVATYGAKHIYLESSYHPRRLVTLTKEVVPSGAPAPVFLDLNDQTLTKFVPHSELVLRKPYVK